jgi:hypothetical protein
MHKITQQFLENYGCEKQEKTVDFFFHMCYYNINGGHKKTSSTTVCVSTHTVATEQKRQFLHGFLRTHFVVLKLSFTLIIAQLNTFFKSFSEICMVFLKGS